MELPSSKFPMYLRRIPIVILTVLELAAGVAAHALTSEQHLIKRINSGEHLTAAAKALASDAKLLTAQARNMQADQKLDVEIHETIDRSKSNQPRRMVAPESRATLENYNTLMARYKAALAAYIQHRQEIQQHATEYHQEAQENQAAGAMPPVTDVPVFRALQLQAQDVCQSMQDAEGALHQIELQLFNEIQYLQAKRKLMPAAEYAAAWGLVDGKAVQLQHGAENFNQSVLTKQGAMDDTMHGKMSQAMRDGDYVESQKVYSEHLRNVSIIQAESKRGNHHYMMAMQFLNELNQLNPNGSGASNAPQGSGFHFVEDDQSLSAEFEQVQQLYKEVEAAAPKFH